MTVLSRGFDKICLAEDFIEKKFFSGSTPFQEIKNVFLLFFPHDVINLILNAGLQSPTAMLIQNRIFELNGSYTMDSSDFLIFFDLPGLIDAD